MICCVRSGYSRVVFDYFIFGFVLDIDFNLIICESFVFYIFIIIVLCLYYVGLMDNNRFDKLL